MLKKILVALDNSDMSAQVFEKALSIAKQLNASLMLLHVLSLDEDESLNYPGFYALDYYPGLSPEAMEIYRTQWEAYKQQGLNLLRQRADQASEGGITVEFAQISGNSGPIICQKAKTWAADLIVIGRRGRSGLSEMLLGSVSNYVLHHAPCSVLVVHREAKEILSPDQPKPVEMAHS
ncbi:MAG TPA: universal stress protein [Crinalium sp.]|jgi:nucleotide-binding universal stress UspA family protein